MAWTPVVPPAHSGLSVAATAICPGWLGPLSPMEDDVAETMLPQTARDVFEDLAEDGIGTLMVPRKRI
jgi:hypothetical protein